VLFPRAGRTSGSPAAGHDELVRAITRPRRTEDRWPELLAELEASTAQIAVLSSEGFQSLRTRHHFAGLRRRLDRHEVRVIAYLRRQDQLLQASYCAAVLFGDETRPFREYRRRFGLALDYRELLGRWERAFGREALIVRPYEPSRLAGGNVVSDFCARLDPPLVVEPRHSAIATDDKTYPRNAVECVRRMRRAGADDQLIADFIEVCGYVYGDRSTDLDVLSPERAVKILERFADSNREVARRYVGREDGRLFEDLEVGDWAAWRARYRGGAEADVLASIDDARVALAALSDRGEDRGAVASAAPEVFAARGR
jgi:hypothetical protein